MPYRHSSPKVSPTKGHHPRAKVLHNVESYQNVMNVILKAVHVRHKEHAKAVRGALLYSAEAVFKISMSSMHQFEPKPDASYEQRIQFNDSVSRLRTIHNQMLQRIRTLNKPPKENVCPIQQL